MKKTKKNLLTFGYGNRRSYDDLFSYFSEFEVDCVIDIRLTPKAWTRKWWGDEIKKACESKQVSYISEPSLGNTSGNKKWIPVNREDAEYTLKSISTKLKGKTILLLCAELDPARCHRSEVAEHLSNLSSRKIMHLQ